MQKTTCLTRFGKGASCDVEGGVCARGGSAVDCGDVGGKGGQPDTTMYRLYMADAKGHIGYIYSSKPHAAGEVVRLGLVERDGKMRLGLVK